MKFLSDFNFIDIDPYSANFSPILVQVQYLFLSRVAKKIPRFSTFNMTFLQNQRTD